MDLLESLNHVLRDADHRLTERFYDLLFERNPEAKPYFQAVNLRHQKALLRMAMQVIVSHYHHRYPATEDYLRVLGHKHFERDIPPALYPPFRDALLAALAAFHGLEWDQSLELEWSAAIDAAIAVMLSGYVPGPLFY